VADGFDDVASAGFAFGADHGCAFGDAAQGFAEGAAAADEGDAEGGFGYVVDGVGGGEDFGFVDVVYAEGFEDLGVGVSWVERGEGLRRKGASAVELDERVLDGVVASPTQRLVPSTLSSFQYSPKKNSRTWHSTKCPILAFAITGIVTVSIISLIIFGSLILATPPWARISAGTRSSAMTATAPASSAILA
jgi:hypothetical protein